jgi:hypothetical protein
MDILMGKVHTYLEAEHELEYIPYKSSKVSASLMAVLVFSKCNSNSLALPDSLPSLK